MGWDSAPKIQGAELRTVIDPSLPLEWIKSDSCLEGLLL